MIIMMIMIIIIISMGRDYVSELRPSTNIFFIPQVIDLYEHGEPWWNYRGNSRFIHQMSLAVTSVESSSSDEGGTGERNEFGLRSMSFILRRVL
jgi:hypothetical protein